jgi:hypothetical protein
MLESRGPSTVRLLRKRSSLSAQDDTCKFAVCLELARQIRNHVVSTFRYV